MPRVAPAFEIRLLDGSWLRIYASGRVKGIGHDAIINRIPALLSAAVAAAVVDERATARDGELPR